MQLHDNVNAREMRADGSYQKVKPAPGEPIVNGQMGMYELLKDDWGKLHHPEEDARLCGNIEYQNTPGACARGTESCVYTD
mgnify:FL=1